MGLSFSELQNLSREQTALYPPRTLPIFSEPSPDERRIASLQLGFAKRLAKSKYLVMDSRLNGRGKDHLERYSDKYLPLLTSRPTLKRKDLHAPFFPNEIFEDYFSPAGLNKKRRITGDGGKGKGKKGTINLDALDEGNEEGVRLSVFPNLIPIERFLDTPTLRRGIPKTERRTRRGRLRRRRRKR